MRIALVASLSLTAALPAAAQPPEPAVPPWSVESPDSLGARFGLGFDLLLDRLDDLEAAAGRQTVTVRGPEGGEETTVVPFDPRLDDRKHGRDWEERSVGVQVPIALPRLPLGRGLSIEPSLVLEAAAVDGRFTVADLVEGRPDRRLDGTGARWGAGVQALGGLCRGCRWFWGAGYRFRILRGLDLDGDAPPGADAPEAAQRTEFDRESHDLTARLGARLAGGRAAAFVGVRSRRSDLVLDDETTLPSPQRREETTVATRLELEGEDTAAIAGVDFRLGRRGVARVEASFGGDGESVLLKLVHGISPRPHGPEAPQAPEAPTPSEVEERRRRAVELADAIAPDVRELKRRFEREADRLEREAGPDRPLPAADVLRLLDDLERGLRETLDARELLPTLAWFLDLLARARIDLTAEGGVVGSRPSAGAPPRGLAFAALPARQDPRPAEPSGTPARGWLATIVSALDLLGRRADTRQLTQDLCVRSEPRPGAKVLLWPRAFAAPDALSDVDTFVKETEGRLDVFYRGLYAYEATLRGHPAIGCPAEDAATRCAPIDLWKGDGPFLVCNFDPDIGHCELRSGDLARCGR